MTHLIRSIFLSIVLFFAPHQTAYTRMVARVESSVVRITGMTNVDTWVGPMQAQYVCSGEVIGVNLVLTANHCIGDSMSVDGKQQLTVVKQDAVADLALIKVGTPKPALVFREAPVVLYEPLTAIGYAWGWPTLTVLKEIPYLLDYSPEADMPPGIFMQGGVIGGMSGGPVVDEDGLLVSINQRSVSNVSYSVNPLLIKAFLLGT